jgi:hypothetical protein
VYASHPLVARRLAALTFDLPATALIGLDRLPDGTLTHWENAAFARRTPIHDIDEPVLYKGALTPVSGHLFTSCFQLIPVAGEICIVLLFNAAASITQCSTCAKDSVVASLLLGRRRGSHIVTRSCRRNR